MLQVLNVHHSPGVPAGGGEDWIKTRARIRIRTRITDHQDHPSPPPPTLLPALALHYRVGANNSKRNALLHPPVLLPLRLLAVLHLGKGADGDGDGDLEGHEGDGHGGDGHTGGCHCPRPPHLRELVYLDLGRGDLLHDDALEGGHLGEEGSEGGVRRVSTM